MRAEYQGMGAKRNMPGLQSMNNVSREKYLTFGMFKIIMRLISGVNHEK
jgi:hypothetical protein